MSRKVGSGPLACSWSRAAGAATAGATTRRTAGTQKLTKVTLQLKWVTQAQFAGYYEAKAKGYYKKAGLDVNDQARRAEHRARAGRRRRAGAVRHRLAVEPDALAREGRDLVSIAQVFNKSGLTQLTWKDTGINTVAKMKDKKVANWLFGNEFEVFAALAKNGMDPAHNKGVTIVQQPFDMDLFLKRQMDAASAMTYNELAQVLETKNPKTGKLYTMNDLNVIKMQRRRHRRCSRTTSSRRRVTEEHCEPGDGEEVPRRVVPGLDLLPRPPADCVNTVLRTGRRCRKGHQTWQMNEINALIWPAPRGSGSWTRPSYKRSAKIVATYGKLTKVPGHEAYRTELAAARSKS